MNRNQAHALVRQVFTQAFDKNRFLEFSRNLLNHIDEQKAQSWNNPYVKDAFKAHVQRYERIGTFTSSVKEKLDVLIVYLTHESKLERTRTALRNFVADHLKTRDEKDAALVAFVSPSENTWRFSYVKMEYATVEKDSGKVGVETRLTPARRFSYIVGAGESCHTAQTRFLDMLQDTQTDPVLKDIEEAFSVEAVTKEFFKKYVELFGKIHEALEKLTAKNKTMHDEFTAKGVNTVDFAKKLMGQIVFLYFLQKKGWLGVARGDNWGDGRRDFLRRLASGENNKYDSFFNDILEPLFYDTLATDRGHEAWCDHFKCRIPFLNGGLFEPPGNYDWRKVAINLPDKLFTNNEFIEEGITGSGVLDVFDRYNFTVNEAEPLEKEVAIDPEMLGKVFENLIEENQRKGLGTYYTPREIVHYMCQESLINYLDTALNTPQTCEVSETSQVLVPRADIETFVHLGEQISHYEAVETEYRIKMPKSIEQYARLIDDKLAEITICDPAVGSGAFLVGMMTEIVRARGALTPYFNDIHERTPYHFKRHAIQNCLYGVDIDPGAVEIAKLRLWLSLVVDEEDVKQIKPLPNLDYKIVPGNSLLGVEKTLFNEQLFRRLEQLKPLYFDESDSAKKAKLKTEIDQLVHELTNGKETFDFKIYFSEVFHRKGGFDIVMANPPYVGEKGHKEMFRSIANGPLKIFYQGKMDLFYFFFHLALNLGREQGHVAFITTNYYITAFGARKLRRDIKSRAAIKRLVNLNELKIFESALGQHNMITILSKTSDEDIKSKNCITKKSGYATPTILQSILSWEDKETEYFTVFQNNLYDGEEYYIRLDGTSGSIGVDPFSNKTNRVLEKIKLAGVALGKICSVDAGLHPGVDRISEKIWRKYPELGLKLDEGVFVLSLREANDFKGKKYLKPLYKSSDIQKWHILTNSYFILYSSPHNEIEDVQFISHISRYRNILENVRKVNNENVKNWKYLRRGVLKEIIYTNIPKIVTPYRSNNNRFAYTTNSCYGSQDVYFITEKSKAISLKYVIALLNSRLYFFWLYYRGKRKGETLELYQKPLSEIPVKIISKEEQLPFITLVDRTLEAKRANPAADTIGLDKEIDQLVYELYGLTEEEIHLVEGR